MVDRGMKIAKEGANIESEDIDDYVFWSKYPTLVLLEKKVVEITSNSTTYSGTEEVEHDWGFIPLVIADVQKSSGSPTTFNNHRYLMPAESFAEVYCDTGEDFESYVTFNYKVKDDQVDIIWVANCQQYFMGGDTEGPLFTQKFEVTLYFYMWELGSSWPL